MSTVPKILVTGSIAYDLLLGYEGSFADALRGKSMEDLSVSFFAPHLERHHGGTGANIAWNLQLLGGDALLVGTVGMDGGSYCALLEERGIDTQHIEQRKDSVTATAIIGTDSSERQITFFHPGSDGLGTWPDLTDEEIAWAIVSPRNAVLMMEAVRWCAQHKIPLLFDPGQQVIALSPDELRAGITASTGVICNAYEWDLLQKRTDWNVKELLKHADYLIVTKGEEGVDLYETGKGGKGSSECTSIAACAADRVVNPTGAGDAFRAGLLHGLSHGSDLLHACRLGASTASFVVEIEGTLLDTLDLDALRERAKQTYGEDLSKIG